MGRIILITGGIGAGKSVVCRMLRAHGMPVYDSDTEARALMDSSLPLRLDIQRELAPWACRPLLNQDQSLCRPAVAEAAFSCPEALSALNATVHPAVLRHLRSWADAQPGVAFVETAIPRSSGLRGIASEEWVVTAPMHLRLSRAMARDQASEQQIRARIRAQESEWEAPHHLTREILNDDAHSLILQLAALRPYPVSP